MSSKPRRPREEHQPKGMNRQIVVRILGNSLTGCSGSFVVEGSVFRLVLDPTPQGADFLGRLSIGRELRDGESGSQRVLMVISLHDVWECEHAHLVQTCGRLGRAIAA